MSVANFVQTFHGHPSLPAAAETLTGARTVTLADPLELWLDPGGADRVVTMPAEADVPGAYYRIANTANDDGEALTVNDDASSPNLIVSIPRQRMATIYCDGSAWSVIGEFIVTSAT